ncbi:hypothetical protein [Nocardioides sp. SR21]|uniref:hypothetical protein n=1 Tax=Nocardioides sp. SR21 TaxID=2919501 RepID=UPI001FAB0156|nr:hypothetical protein [Nocardioides sp. SR21]
MDLVTHESATMLEHDQAQRLLLEMAAVVRTVFGVQQTASRSAPDAPVVVVATTETEAFPGTAVPAVATTPSLAVPTIAVPTIAVPTIPAPAPAIPVPALAVPALPVPDLHDPEERHSMTLLQEIAFLDE